MKRLLRNEFLTRFINLSLIFLHSFLSGVVNFFNLYLYLFLSVSYGTQAYYFAAIPAICRLCLLLKEISMRCSLSFTVNLVLFSSKSRCKGRNFVQFDTAPDVCPGHRFNHPPPPPPPPTHTHTHTHTHSKGRVRFGSLQ